MTETNKGIAAFGDLGLNLVFGVENNEIHRKVYLMDPANDLVPLLETLFGKKDKPQLMACFEPFNHFFVFSTNIEPIHQRGVQGDSDTADADTFDEFLRDWPTVVGGVSVDIAYRPMERQYSESGSYYNITEEAWDYSAQIMSLLGNNFAQNPSCLRWDDQKGKDQLGTPITNLTAISKIIPKIEFLQRKVYVTSLPDENQIGLIGHINDGLVKVGRQDNNTISSWPESCVLLVGLPTIRRWRFDDAFVAEIGVKLAINSYRDFTEDSPTKEEFVTWNRLYKHDEGLWRRVLLGEKADRFMYQSADLSQVLGMP